MYQTTPKRSNREPLQSLDYGIKANIPLDAGMPTNRTSWDEERGNDDALAKEFDFTKEQGNKALMKLSNQEL